MVKQSQPPKKRPDVNKDGTPRQKPGKKANPDDVKADRLVLRVHPDLMSVLTERARERGVNRSQYVEKLLIGWANLDPRNPRLDLIGKQIQPAPDFRQRSSFGFVERWQRFANVSKMILGFEPPREWVEQDHDDSWRDETMVDPDVHKKPAADDDQPAPWKRK